MRKHILLSAFGCAVLAALWGCTQEVPEIPSYELYLREWVKNFGVVNPAQDWNNATRGTVDVNVQGSATVKVAANIGGKSYLLANYKDVSGSRKLSFDIPRGVKDITVFTADERVRTSVGASVSFTAGRAVADPSGEGATGITAELNTDRKDWMVVPMLNATIFRRKMPEGCYNADRAGVSTDFRLKFKKNDIIVRPLFWHTIHTHEFGLFYVNDEGKPVRFPIYNMEKNTESAPVDGLALCWAPTETRSITIPDFLNDADFMAILANHGITKSERTGKVWGDTEFKYDFININSLDNFADKTSSTDDHNMTMACREYLASKGINNNPAADEEHRFNYVYRWRFTGDALTYTVEQPWGVQEEKTVLDLNMANYGTDNTVRKDLEIVYTIYNYDYANAKGWGNDAQMNSGVKMDNDNYPALISKGIKVHIDDISKSYGGYIKREDGRYLYSESSLNEKNRWIPKPGAERYYDSGMQQWVYNESDFMIEDGKKAFRAATWVGEKYAWRYMSFEDGVIGDSYSRNSCDFDMQDFVFIIENYPDDGDDPVDIIDNDDPKPVKWLIACEDLGAKDDFDFNDVVFEIEYVSGEKKAKITPLAAGGTLPVYLKRNGEYAHPSGKVEWHELFGVYDSSKMINTTSFGGAGKSFEIEVPEDFTLTSSVEGSGSAGENYRMNLGGFHLEVERPDGTTDVVEPPSTGDAPQMFLIFQSADKPWRWPLERHHITLAYTRFSEWMEKPGYEIAGDGTDWFDSVSGEHVVKR